MNQREADRRAWSIAFRILDRNEPAALSEDDANGELPEADYERMVKGWDKVVQQAFNRSYIAPTCTCSLPDSDEMTSHAPLCALAKP